MSVFIYWFPFKSPRPPAPAQHLTFYIYFINEMNQWYNHIPRTFFESLRIYKNIVTLVRTAGSLYVFSSEPVHWTNQQPICKSANFRGISWLTKKKMSGEQAKLKWNHSSGCFMFFERNVIFPFFCNGPSPFKPTYFC